jgi:hypothetical protein
MENFKFLTRRVDVKKKNILYTYSYTIVISSLLLYYHDVWVTVIIYHYVKYFNGYQHYYSSKKCTLATKSTPLYEKTSKRPIGHVRHQISNLSSTGDIVQYVLGASKKVLIPTISKNFIKIHG